MVTRQVGICSACCRRFRRRLQDVACLLKEKQLEAQRQPRRWKGRAICTHSTELEARVRVLEQIVTDGGVANRPRKSRRFARTAD